MILDNAQAPLYVQLADLFRQRIVKGVWKEGEKLPSLEQLVAEFEVARVTVRQAIERLTRDGLVSPQRGRGTFVTGAPQQRPLAARRDLAAATSPTSIATRHPTILNIDESSTRTPRLVDGDGVAAPRVRLHAPRPLAPGPAVLRHRHLPRRRDLRARGRRASASETVIPLLLAMPSVKIATARQVLTISTADLEVARHLGIQRQRAGRRGAARLHRAEAARDLSRRGHLPRRLRPRRVRPQGVSAARAAGQRPWRKSSRQIFSRAAAIAGDGAPISTGVLRSSTLP